MVSHLVVVEKLLISFSFILKCFVVFLPTQFHPCIAFLMCKCLSDPIINLEFDYNFNFYLSC